MALQEPAPFGVMVRRYRRYLGLTQEELAERAGLSERAIREMERGVKHVPRKETVRLLAEALELAGIEWEAFQRSARRVGEPAYSGALGGPRSNLPDEPTLFIGRVREIKEICDLLRRATVRLVTLTGPGGIGKTRLALQAAEILGDQFGDDVYFVSLASLHDPDLVPSAIAPALGIEGRAGQQILDTVTAVLQTKQGLLVLDNFEHLLPAANVVSHLRAACPGLHILVTSRAILHLTAEHEYPVPSLKVPELHQLVDLDTLGQHDAITLFVARAQTARPTFVLTHENARAVVEICHRLDGSPLAIELAAARLRLLPPQSLLERLSQALDLLTGGPRDQPARHQTLRATIDWSYNLLAPAEQTLFARLSVFAGGCTLEAAERICSPDRNGTTDVLNGMTSLVEQSLVRQEGEVEPRCVMLETIRQYAAERLAQAGDAEVRQQHAAYYLWLAEEAAEEFASVRRTQWLDGVEREHDNMRAALRWAQETGEAEVGLRLAIALSPFWEARGHVSEGRRWLAEILALTGNDMPELRAAALKTAALLAEGHLDFRGARDLLEQSLDLTRELGDERALAEALIHIGRATSAGGVAGGPDQARDPLEQGLALARSLGDRALISTALYHLAQRNLDQGYAVGALPLAEESLLLARELGDAKAVGFALTNLVWALGVTGDRGRVRALLAESMAMLRSPGFYLDAENRDWIMALGIGARCQGTYEAARALFRQAVVLSLEAGDQGSVSYFWVWLALLEREQGRYEQAQLLLEKSVATFEELGDSGGMSHALIGLADVARDQGDADDTISFSERSLGLFRRLHASPSPYIGFCLNNLAMAAWVQGDYPRAESLLSEALTCMTMQEEILLSVGLVALDQHEYARAEQVFAKILGLGRGQIMVFMAAPILEGMAGVAVGRGRLGKAARLLGAADALRRRIGTPLMPLHRPLHERQVTAAKAALGEEQFQQRWTEGQTMTMEEAINYALESLASPCESGQDVQLSTGDQDGSSLQRLTRSQRQATAIEHIRLAGCLSPRAYASLFEVSVDTALRDLRGLVDQGVVRATGTTKDRRYVLANEVVDLPIRRTM